MSEGFLHALSPFPVLLNRGEEGHALILAKAILLTILVGQDSFIETTIAHQP